MLTIILTYRNRDINIVKRCLLSLNQQSNKNFNVIIVDYGSYEEYSNALMNISQEFNFVEVVYTKTQKQLWNKSRAINIGLKLSVTPYIFVGDIDMIYHNEFVAKLHELKDENTFTYFQVGFLGEEVSKLNKQFENYNVDFLSNDEATGMTLFSVLKLRQINGFDEFYHGWGSEDTDVHQRLISLGVKRQYYSKELLILHQWHSKNYRQVNFKSPFHSYLEKINSDYLKFASRTKRVKANEDFNWGFINKDLSLDNIAAIRLNITNRKPEVKAFIANILLSEKDKIITVSIKKHIEFNSLKQKIKKITNNKAIPFLEMQEVNDLLLECIIFNLRDQHYTYEFDAQKLIINLTIKL